MPDLLFEKRAGVAYLTFNRPERRNAISPQMMLQLADAWLEFRDDPALPGGGVPAAGRPQARRGGAPDRPRQRGGRARARAAARGGARVAAGEERAARAAQDQGGGAAHERRAARARLRDRERVLRGG